MLKYMAGFLFLMTVFNISCYIITLFKFTCIKDISKSVIYSLHEGRFVFYCGKKNHIIWHLNTKTNLSASYIVKYKHDVQQISKTSPSYDWNSIPCKQQLSIFPYSAPGNYHSTSWKWNSLSCVRHFASPWTLWSMELSRPEYWSG